MTYHRFGNVTVRVYDREKDGMDLKPHAPEIVWPSIHPCKLGDAVEMRDNLTKAIEFVEGYGK